MDKSHPIGHLLLDFQRLLADFFTKNLKETQHNTEDAYMDKNLIKGKKWNIWIDHQFLEHSEVSRGIKWWFVVAIFLFSEPQDKKLCCWNWITQTSKDEGQL